MTTMSVQLRRVVYLLVLLQCFVCVACAADGVNVNYTDAEINGDGEIDDQLKILVRQTLLLLRDSQIPLANATACKAIWEGAIKANNATVNRSRDAFERIKKLDERIKEYTEKVPQGGFALKLKKEVNREGFRKLVNDIKEELENNAKDIPNEEAVATIDEAVYTKHVCLTVRGNAENALENLKRKLENYETFKEETARSTKAKEVNQAGKSRRDALEKILKELKEVQLDATRSVSKAKDQVRAWADAVGRFSRLGEMVTKLENTDDVPARNEIKAENNETVLKITRVATEQKVKDIRKLINEVDDATKTRRETVVEKVKEKVETANVEAAARVEEEVREAIKAKKIADEEEKARKAREEEARRVAEEKARQKAEEERARKAREEEEARRVAEEKAKQKAEEEKARQAGEKTREEQTRQAAEKTEKKKDGGSSPSLVHSPLLLLLLSVVGCTLVC
ncbi:uncharacterized protein TM35_000062950 [Trypanosoma theileri]|uniref:Uncharacterized protein n=1 Tax=Trypanosoma theileri TaxID=67003 RepID=A0A1X0P4B9_9TRYP|nr:uncharacterized protein TM35_000062950 [Trypanosoma theileri]ORC91290.1 hypothetical protein TM35_000062950 [Trypanosoma theileri]